MNHRAHRIIFNETMKHAGIYAVGKEAGKIVLDAQTRVLLAGGEVKADDGVKLTGGNVLVAAVAERDSSYRTSSSSWGVGGLTLAAETGDEGDPIKKRRL